MSGGQLAGARAARKRLASGANEQHNDEGQQQAASNAAMRSELRGARKMSGVIYERRATSGHGVEMRFQPRQAKPVAKAEMKSSDAGLSLEASKRRKTARKTTTTTTTRTAATTTSGNSRSGNDGPPRGAIFTISWPAGSGARPGGWPMASLILTASLLAVYLATTANCLGAHERHAPTQQQQRPRLAAAGSLRANGVATPTSQPEALSIDRFDDHEQQISAPLLRAPTTLAPLGGQQQQPPPRQAAASQAESSYMSPEERALLMRSQEAHYEGGAGQQPPPPAQLPVPEARRGPTLQPEAGDEGQDSDYASGEGGGGGGELEGAAEPGKQAQGQQQQQHARASFNSNAEPERQGRRLLVATSEHVNNRLGSTSQLPAGETGGGEMGAEQAGSAEEADEEEDSEVANNSGSPVGAAEAVELAANAAAAAAAAQQAQTNADAYFSRKSAGRAPQEQQQQRQYQARGGQHNQLSLAASYNHQNNQEQPQYQANEQQADAEAPGSPNSLAGGSYGRPPSEAFLSPGRAGDSNGINSNAPNVEAAPPNGAGGESANGAGSGNRDSNSEDDEDDEAAEQSEVEGDAAPPAGMADELNEQQQAGALPAELAPSGGAAGDHQQQQQQQQQQTGEMSSASTSNRQQNALSPAPLPAGESLGSQLRRQQAEAARAEWHRARLRQNPHLLQSGGLSSAAAASGSGSGSGPSLPGGQQQHFAQATTTRAPPYNPQNNPSHAGKYFIN